MGPVLLTRIFVEERGGADFSSKMQVLKNAFVQMERIITFPSLWMQNVGLYGADFTLEISPG